MQNRHVYRVITHQRPKVYLILGSSNFAKGHEKASRFRRDLGGHLGTGLPSRTP